MFRFNLNKIKRKEITDCDSDLQLYGISDLVGLCCIRNSTVVIRLESAVEFQRWQTKMRIITSSMRILLADSAFLYPGERSPQRHHLFNS